MFLATLPRQDIFCINVLVANSNLIILERQDNRPNSWRRRLRAVQVFPQRCPIYTQRFGERFVKFDLGCGWVQFSCLVVLGPKLTRELLRKCQIFDGLLHPKDSKNILKLTAVYGKMQLKKHVT